jgi:hypothetical protein
MFLISNLWGQNSDGAYQKTMLKVVKIILETRKSIICNFVPSMRFFFARGLRWFITSTNFVVNFIFSLKIVKFLISFIWMKNLSFFLKYIRPNLLF